MTCVASRSACNEDLAMKTAHPCLPDTKFFIAKHAWSYSISDLFASVPNSLTQSSRGNALESNRSAVRSARTRRFLFFVLGLSAWVHQSRQRLANVPSFRPVLDGGIQSTSGASPSVVKSSLLWRPFVRGNVFEHFPAFGWLLPP